MSNIEDSTFSRLLRVSNIHGIGPNDTQSNFTVNLNRMTETDKIVRAVLKSCSFPNNAYNIQDEGDLKNNVFTYQVNAGPVVNVTVPAGNYNTTQILSLIVENIEAVLVPIEPTATISMSIGAISGKIEAVLTGSVAIIDFTSTGSLNQLLGNTVFTILTATPAGATYTFEETPDLYGLKTVYIHSLEMAEGNLVDGDVETHDIIGHVPVASIVPFGGLVQYYARDDELESINYDSVRNYDSINISLRDLDNNIIKLEGGAPTELVFKIYYV